MILAKLKLTGVVCLFTESVSHLSLFYERTNIDKRSNMSSASATESGESPPSSKQAFRDGADACQM